MPLSNGYNLGLLVDGVEGEEHYLDLMKLFRGIDGLVQPRVEDKDRTAPPANIVDGQMYIIPAGATGAWSGRTNMIARGFTVGTGAPGWQYFLPKKGWSVLVLDEGDKDGVPLEYRFTGTAWAKPDLGPTREEVLSNPMTSYGDIIVAVDEGAPTRLAAGGDLQVLTSIDGMPQWRDAQVGGGGGPGGGMENPMLASQDIIVGGDNGAPVRLPKGTNGYVLQISVDGLIVWGPQASGGGGMDNPMSSAGDIIYGGASGVPTRLAKGTDGQVLKLVGGLPAWAEDQTGGGGGTGMVNPMTTARDLIIGGTGGTPTRLPNGTAGQLLGVNGWTTLPAYVPASAVGTTIATLDGAGKVPAAQLPSYVDDVLEFFTLASFPFPGEAGKIYVALNTNRQYRWPDGGSDYVELVASPGTTDNVVEGTTNKYWTAARTIASAITGFVTTNAAVVVATDTIVQAFGKLQAQISALGTSKLDATATAAAATKLATPRNINGTAFDGTANITVTAVDDSKLPLAGGKMTGPINGATPQTMAAAATMNIGASTSQTINVTLGTGTINALGTIAAGAERTLVFGDVITINHSPSGLILPGYAPIKTVIGDTAVFESLGAGNWKCKSYNKVNGRQVALGAAPVDVPPDATTATTRDIYGPGVPVVTVGGTSAVGYFGSGANGQEVTVVFTSSIDLYNSSVIVLPGAANITTSAGDSALFVYMGSGVTKCVSFTRGAGTVVPGVDVVGSNANGTFIKYATGVLECYFYQGDVTFAAVARQNLTWTFPLAFVGNLPVVTFAGAARTGASIVPVSKAEYAQGLTTGGVAVQAFSGTIDNVRDTGWRAVGRWK